MSKGVGEWSVIVLLNSLSSMYIEMVNGKRIVISDL